MLPGDGTDMTIKIIWQSNFPYKLVELIMYDAYGAQWSSISMCSSFGGHDLT